jgi:hypothetical protein
MKAQKVNFKHVAFLVALFGFIYYEFSTIYVPDNFENPIFYRFTAVFLKVLGASVSFDKIKIQF